MTGTDGVEVGLDKTVEEALADKPGWVRETLVDGLAQRRMAASLEEDAKAIKKAANEKLASAMEAAGIDKIPSSIGTVSKTSGTRSSLKTDKLEEALLSKGVPAATVSAAIKEATVTTEYTSITFRLPKKKGGKK